MLPTTNNDQSLSYWLGDLSHRISLMLLGKEVKILEFTEQNPIPTEIFIKFFPRITYKSLANAHLVCKSWARDTLVFLRDLRTAESKIYFDTFQYSFKVYSNSCAHKPLDSRGLKTLELNFREQLAGPLRTVSEVELNTLLGLAFDMPISIRLSLVLESIRTRKIRGLNPLLFKHIINLIKIDAFEEVKAAELELLKTPNVRNKLEDAIPELQACITEGNEKKVYDYLIFSEEIKRSPHFWVTITKALRSHSYISLEQIFNLISKIRPFSGQMKAFFFIFYIPNSGWSLAADKYQTFENCMRDFEAHNEGVPLLCNIEIIERFLSLIVNARLNLIGQSYPTDYHPYYLNFLGVFLENLMCKDNLDIFLTKTLLKHLSKANTDYLEYNVDYYSSFAQTYLTPRLIKNLNSIFLRTQNLVGQNIQEQKDIDFINDAILELNEASANSSQFWERKNPGRY